MTEPANLNARIIEGLYAEGLMLSDEVRATFDLSHQDEVPDEAHSARIALSCEALRTTTRMMHVLAWLLNHRAYFAGELSEFQLRRHGVLPPDRAADPEQLAKLEPETCALIAETEAFHGRVARLDAAWRERFVVQPAVLGMRERLGRSLGSL